jgi:hypothetical protein
MEDTAVRNNVPISGSSRYNAKINCGSSSGRTSSAEFQPLQILCGVFS